MTAMTEFQLDAIYDAAYEHRSGCGAHGAGLRAVAEAAIAADRAQGEEPVGWMLECPTMTGDTAWILSWSKSGAGLCNRLAGDAHERPLYTRPQPVAVPDGWKLVPVEPNHLMIFAAEKACREHEFATTMQLNREVYRAMLAAAPCSPAAQHADSTPAHIVEATNMESPEYSSMSNKALCELYSEGYKQPWPTKKARHVAGLRAVEVAVKKKPLPAKPPLGNPPEWAKPHTVSLHTEWPPTVENECTYPGYARAPLSIANIAEFPRCAGEAYKEYDRVCAYYVHGAPGECGSPGCIDPHVAVYPGVVVKLVVFKETQE